MKTKATFLLLTLATIVAWKCSEEPVKPPPGPDPAKTSIVLTHEFSNCTTNILRVEIKAEKHPQAFTLTRDGVEFFQGRLFGSDTTLHDTGLRPSASYSYRALRIDSSLHNDTSATIVCRTMDTTSGSFTWRVLYIGDGMSELYDVFAVSDTDVYAVGSFYFKDSTGQLNLDKIFNAFHWNGKVITPMQVPVEICPSGNFSYPTLETVFAFNHGEILFGMGLIIRYDLRRFITDCSVWGKTGGNSEGIWGQLSTKVYIICGSPGHISIRDNDTYRKMDIPTNLDLTDIFGNSVDIWCVGGRPNKKESVALYHRVDRWESVDSLALWGRACCSVWCDEKPYDKYGFLVLAGRGVYYRDLEWQEVPFSVANGGQATGKLYFNRVRGTARNNVFAAGDFGITAHYNGVRWRTFPEILRYPNSRFITSVSVSENHVFAVGMEDTRGVFIIGTRQ